MNVECLRWLLAFWWPTCRRSPFAVLDIANSETPLHALLQVASGWKTAILDGHILVMAYERDSLLGVNMPKLHVRLG